MDVGSFISRQISQMAQSNSSQLGLPTLITALSTARGFVPDSLTFKSLSPAINMAYIRKNCCNPDDPTITYLGTRHFCSFLLCSPCSSSTSTTSSRTSTLRHLRSEHIDLTADTAEPSPWLMPGDAEHSRFGSASNHCEHGGFHGTCGLARSPAFSCGGR